MGSRADSVVSHFVGAIGMHATSLAVACAIAMFLIGGAANAADDYYCAAPAISIDRPDLSTADVRRLCAEEASFQGDDWFVSGTSCTLCPPGFVRTRSGTSSGSGAVDADSSADGKYCGFLYGYYCPNDGDHPPYTDYGYWAGGSDVSCGETGLPGGYYVYDVDTWYVFDRLCAGSSAGGSAVDAYGSYCDLLGTYHCPNDGTYPPYTDYGYWGGGDDESCNATGLPAGYYVYETDTWYVYGRTC